VLVAAHGLTGTHAEFHALADQLGAEATIVAPDLRGRGGSATAGPPYGFSVHADDLVAVMDHLGVERATVLGHSMGGFVAAGTARRHPERVDQVVLVDGGLPVARGPLTSPLVAGAIRQLYRRLPAPARRRVLERLLQRLIGSTLQRLDRVFPSEQEYVAFWRAHPALAAHWNP
jgi:pimeloyl-ACP methyl ester carboxylesterase